MTRPSVFSVVLLTVAVCAAAVTAEAAACDDSLQLYAWVSDAGVGGTINRVSPCTNQSTVVATVPKDGPKIAGESTVVGPANGAGVVVQDCSGQGRSAGADTCCEEYWAPVQLSPAKGQQFVYYSWALRSRSCPATGSYAASSSVKVVPVGFNYNGIGFTEAFLAHDPVKDTLWELLGNYGQSSPVLYVSPRSNVSQSNYVDLSACKHFPPNDMLTEPVSLFTVPSERAAYVGLYVCLDSSPCFEFYVTRVDMDTNECEFSRVINNENNGGLPYITAVWPNAGTHPTALNVLWLGDPGGYVNDVGAFSGVNMTGPWQGLWTEEYYSNGMLFDFGNAPGGWTPRSVLVSGDVALVYGDSETLWVLDQGTPGANSKMTALNTWQVPGLNCLGIIPSSA